MKISIITVSYNSEQFLESCIQSVAAQNYTNIEYIIIDGASTDNTINIIQKYKEHVTFFVSEPDKGMYHAINKGLKMCTGEMVGLLHSDDILESESTISSIVKQAKATKSDLVYGDLLYVQQSDISQTVRYWQAGTFTKSKLLAGWMPPHPTVYIRRNLLQQHGLYHLDYRIAADYDWMLRFLSQTITVTYLPQVLVRMRMGGASNKNLKNILIKMQDDTRALYRNKIGSVFTIPFTLVLKNVRKISQFFVKN